MMLLSLWKGDICWEDPRPEGGMRTILAQTAADYGLSPAEIRGPRRFRVFIHPRQDFMWRCRQIKWPGGRHRYSYPVIGAFLGGRHHTTALHGDRAHARRMAAELKVAA